MIISISFDSSAAAVPLTCRPTMAALMRLRLGAVGLVRSVLQAMDRRRGLGRVDDSVGAEHYIGCSVQPGSLRIRCVANDGYGEELRIWHNRISRYVELPTNSR